MPLFEVLIEDTGESYPCADNRSLLQAMETLNHKGIPAGCRNGGCGVCKVEITAGTYTRQVMSRAHVSESDEQAGCVRPNSDIRLKVVGGIRKAVCRD